MTRDIDTNWDRVHQLIGARVEEIESKDGEGYASIYLTHRGCDDDACVVPIRIADIRWVYPELDAQRETGQ